jgi:hypothetical protein
MKLSVNVVTALFAASGLAVTAMAASVCGTTTQVRRTTPDPQTAPAATPTATPAPAPVEVEPELFVPKPPLKPLEWSCPPCGRG